MNDNMIEKLKNNERPLFVIKRDDPEMVEEMKKLTNHIEERFNGKWRLCLSPIGAYQDQIILRLRPDYVEPLKERWFVCVGTHNNGGLYRVPYRDAFANDGNWLELKTDEELAYVKNRPEGCRFGKVAANEIWVSYSGCEVQGLRPNKDFLSGYCWIKDVPKSVEDRFKYYEIKYNQHGYYIETEDEVTYMPDAINSPKFLGIFAGVQFDGNPTWSIKTTVYIDRHGQLWDTNEIGDDSLNVAVPVRARFEVTQ
jgi:hypothetical protein